MKRIATYLLACFALAAPAWATDDVRPVAQVPLVPLAEAVPEDVDALIRAFWAQYYNTADENAFTRDNLRIGRIDLDEDGRPELVVMVDAPGWEADHGNPFVLAQWRKNRWVAIGWGWGDEDTVFATSEVLGGWRSVDGGKVVLRWQGREYRAEEKTAGTP